MAGQVDPAKPASTLDPANPARLPDLADLAAVEARLWAVLDPYRGRLEAGSVYGVETLRRPGVVAHDFFAGIKPAPGSSAST